jgi:hypothetical protein
MKTISLWVVGISLFLCFECLKPELVEVRISERRKRELLYFVREISKLLFGTLTQAGARE